MYYYKAMSPESLLGDTRGTFFNAVEGEPPLSREVRPVPNEDQDRRKRPETGAKRLLRRLGPRIRLTGSATGPKGLV
jgi:hypothetical protein